MQTYWASVLLILKTVVKEIDRILKKFLWSHGSVKKGKLKIAWKIVCTPKCEGGLGLKQLGDWNEVLLSKLIWKIVGNNLALLELRDKIRPHIVHIIGNGRYISMWNDYWNEMGQLSNFVTNKEIYDARMDENSCVADMIMENEWVWPKNWARKFTQLEKLKDGVKDKMYLGRISNDWGDIVKRITDLPCNNSIRSVLRRFVLATSVYYIWKERNSRLFSSDIKKVDILLHDIKENIRLQLQGLKVKESKQVKIVAAEWNEKRVFGWQFNIEMLFTQKQLVMNPDSSESLIGNATYWNGMLDMAWISSSGLPALAGGHLSDAFTVWFQLEDNSEGNVAKRDCFPEQLLSK
ncbi:hypothetical protein Tco_1106099 [Tanacetum coccineum]